MSRHPIALSRIIVLFWNRPKNPTQPNPMNAHTAQQMLAAVADEVASDNDLPEESAQAVIRDEQFLETFTADLISVASSANPNGDRQEAEDEASAEFLRNSHERILVALQKATTRV